MIIANGTDERDRDVFFFGLSKENIKRLLANQPIEITRESHGEGIPENLHFVIFTGEDEAGMARTFLAAKAIHPGQIRTMPKGAT